MMVRVALAEEFPIAAVIVTVVFVVTPKVLTVNVAVDCPFGTVTFAGGTALALLDDNWTITPLNDAAVVRVTVPVEEVPPVTLGGLSVRRRNLGTLKRDHVVVGADVHGAV